ncbi:MAG: geranylgeranyl diphosphate reductase [Lautropia sp.]
MSAAHYDVAVIGGGPAGATAAADLARAGHSVVLLDRPGRIKPCGGAIPPRLLTEFEVPASVVKTRVDGASIVAPSGRRVDMPIGDGQVSMVDRDVFDPWLRARAASLGAELLPARFERIERRDRHGVEFTWCDVDGRRSGRVRARAMIGADGARSQVAREFVLPGDIPPPVFAYHEIIRTPDAGDAASFDAGRCEVHYDGRLSPDFYAWVFPHGDTISVGTGSLQKGFSLRASIGRLRAARGLDRQQTLRREGAPIPTRPLARWDDGRHVVLAGDAAGVVAPASGEGIYYAMLGGRLAADAVGAFLARGDARELAGARKRFMRSHGNVFRMLGMMQYFWYANDARRERFVSICRDRDVQQLTWDAYMNKALVRARPIAHARIFLKNLSHLTGFAAT